MAHWKARHQPARAASTNATSPRPSRRSASALLSIAITVPLLLLSESVLEDSLTSRSASRSASTTASPASPARGTTATSLTESARNFLLLGLGPLLGGLMLFGIGDQGGVLLRARGKRRSQSLSSGSRCRCGWASAAWSSASCIMLVSRPYFREFFSRKTETAPPGLLDQPPSSAPAAPDGPRTRDATAGTSSRPRVRRRRTSPPRYRRRSACRLPPAEQRRVGSSSCPCGEPSSARRSRNGFGGNASGPSTPVPFHVALVEQLERDDRVDRRLPHDRLAAVLAHRVLVVHEVVEVGRARLCRPCPCPSPTCPRRCARSSARRASRGRAARRRPRRAGPPATPRTDTGSVESRPSLCSVRRHVDELLAEPVLERDPLAVHPARDQHDLLVLHVHALAPGRSPRGTRTPRARRTARSCRSRARAPRSAAGSGTPRSSSRSRTSARTHSPRPRGRRRRAPRLRRSSRTAPRRRSAANTSDRPGSTPIPTSASRPACSHASCSASCCSPSIIPGQLVGALGVGVRQRHRHVQVGDRGLERRAEDRLVEARVAGVQHGVGPHAADQLDQLLAVEASTRSAAKRSGSPEPLARPPARARARRPPAPPARSGAGAGRSPQTPPPRPGSDHEHLHLASVTQSHPERPSARDRMRRMAQVAAVCCPDPRGPEHQQP